jgi:hypothetical protein
MTKIYTMTGHLIRRLQRISVSVFAHRMRAFGHGLPPGLTPDERTQFTSLAARVAKAANASARAALVLPRAPQDTP